LKDDSAGANYSITRDLNEFAFIKEINSKKDGSS